MHLSAKKRGLRWVEGLAFGAGALALLLCLAARSEMWGAEAAAKQTSVSSGPSYSVSSGQTDKRGHEASADVLGRIEVPALHLSAPVTNSVEKLELIRGVGHIPGSAVPGGLGTMALAGHRDTFFRALRNIKPGMEVRVGDGTGTYRYEVDGTKVVQPEDVGVLAIGREPSLVLITCYPFNYIGAAPQRFIVHARLLSLEPVGTGT